MKSRNQLQPRLFDPKRHLKQPSHWELVEAREVGKIALFGIFFLAAFIITSWRALG